MEPHVGDLIGDEGRLDEEKVHQYLSDGDAEQVLAMPLPYKAREDWFLWPHSKTSDPQARSVYRRLREVQRSAEDRAHTTNAGQGQWKAIWGVNLIPKVKNFIWRLATNAVTIRTNLIRRGIATKSECPVGGDPETREHMLLECKWTEPVWLAMTGTRPGNMHVTNTN